MNSSSRSSRHLGRAADDEAHGRTVGLRQQLVLPQHQLVHGGDAGRVGAALAFDGADHLHRIDVVQDDDRAAAFQHGEQAREHAVGVEHGHGQ